MFPGAAGAWPAMGQALYATEPAFRASVDACDRVARDLGVPVADAVRGVASHDQRQPSGDTGPTRLLEVVTLGVVQVALCDLWAAAGVEPDATLSLSLNPPRLRDLGPWFCPVQV